MKAQKSTIYVCTLFVVRLYVFCSFQTYVIGPQMSLFGPDISDASVKFNNFRVYGTFLVIILGTIVFFGVKLVNKFATVALVCVLFTIFSIFLGIGINMNGNHKAEYVQ